LGDGEQSRTSGGGQRTTLNAIPGEYHRGCRGPIGSSEERRARVRKSARRTDLYAPRRRGSIKSCRRRRRPPPPRIVCQLRTFLPLSFPLLTCANAVLVWVCVVFDFGFYATKDRRQRYMEIIM